jgi:hypothetical protein
MEKRAAGCNSQYRRLDLVPGMGHAFDQKALPAVNNALDWLLAEHTIPTRQRQY